MHSFFRPFLLWLMIIIISATLSPLQNLAWGKEIASQPVDAERDDPAEGEEDPFKENGTEDPFQDKSNDKAEEENESGAEDPFQDKSNDKKVEESVAEDPFQDESNDKAEEESVAEDPFQDESNDKAVEESGAEDPFQDESNDKAEEENESEAEDSFEDEPAETDVAAPDQLITTSDVDEKPVKPRTQPKNKPLANPNTKQPDELTSAEIEKTFKEIVNNDPRGFPAVLILRDLTNVDSVKVAYDPESKTTHFDILTQNKQNLTNVQKNEVESAIKIIFGVVLEKISRRSSQEHTALMDGVDVRIRANRIPPTPLLPNAKLTGAIKDGSTLEITVILDKPALDDSTWVEVKGPYGNNLKITIPKGKFLGRTQVPLTMPGRIKNTGLSPTDSVVRIIDAHGVLAPPLGEGVFVVEFGSSPSPPTEEPISREPVDLTGHEACPACAPVYCCPSCSRKQRRR